jgi:predicted permease
LLIACVNVANLQLAEVIRRRRELAIRTAIGAGRVRLVRQLLTESLLVTTIGCAGGLLIAYGGIGLIRRFAPVGLWQLQALEMDGSAIVLATTLALTCAGFVATLPILATATLALAESLRASSRAGRALGHRRAHGALVVSEVALALVLLIGAGLMLRSLAALSRTERGFDASGVAVVTVQAWSYYPTTALRAEFVRQASERLARVPGIEVVGMTSSLPLSWPIGQERTRIGVEGRPVAPGDEPTPVRVAAATADYFPALQIPLRRGRTFAATDVAGSPPVVVVNEAFARAIFGDENPIGKWLTFAFVGGPVQREIVGVVGDMRHEGLHADPSPTVFVPHAQASTGAIHLVARVSGDPAAFQRSIRAELARVNGAMPLTDFTTMDALVSQSLRERRFQLGLLGCFSVTALVLAAIGIYGVMSRATAERTHEIGVRMAVGAAAGSVRFLVLRSGGRLAIAGIVIGLAAALALTRYMAGMLYGVTPLDPLSYVAAAAVLLTAALLATVFPAWRASSVDPVKALRND